MKAVLWRVFRLPIAPAVWLERTRGRTRVALVAAYAVVAMGLGVLAWPWVNLRSIPAVSDPFAAAVKYDDAPPDGENAYVVYRNALARLHPLPVQQPQTGLRSLWRPSQRIAWRTDWSFADTGLRSWLEDNRDALEIWRKATERSRAVDQAFLEERGAFAPADPAGLLISEEGFGRLARLQAAKLAAEGDMAGAWSWHRALLRSLRHAEANRLDDAVHRDVLNALSLGQEAISDWARDKRTDPALLRKALVDIDALDAMPLSKAPVLYAAYRRVLRAIDDPSPDLMQRVERELESQRDPMTWYHALPGAAAVHWYSRNERPRSSRVLRLVFANWLEYADRSGGPAAALAPRTETLSQPNGERWNLTLFVPPAAAARNTARPATFDWYDSTLLLKRTLPDYGARMCFTETARGAEQSLVEELVRQLYYREHGIDPDEITDRLRREYLRRAQGRQGP